MIKPGATILLSGPVAGLPDFGYSAARTAAARLTEQGYRVYSYHDHALGTDAPYSEYMRLALGRLLVCDAVVVLPGWEQSRGACVEVAAALAVGLPVYLDGYPRHPLNVTMSVHPVVSGFRRAGL